MHEYDEALAVGRERPTTSRYEAGIWKIIPPSDFARDMAGLFRRLRCPVLVRKIASVGGDPGTDYFPSRPPAYTRLFSQYGVLDTLTSVSQPTANHTGLRTLCGNGLHPPVGGRNAETTRQTSGAGSTDGTSGNADKRDGHSPRCLWYWRKPPRLALFLDVTGTGGSGKSILAGNCDPARQGKTNATAYDHRKDALESPRERGAGLASLIRLPDRDKWSGDDAEIKAITGGDAVSVDPKYRDAYSAYIPAVICREQ